MLPTASPTCSSPLTHMSITCLHLSNYDVFLRLHRLQWYWHTVDTWVKLAANQIMIPASGIIDGRLSKQSLQPPRPTFRRLFFSPKPRSACRFFICPRSTCEPVRKLGFWEQTGSLSKNDGDGYENVSLKVKSHCFKNFIALIPPRSIRQMLAIFFWIWILKIFIKVQEKKTKVAVVCSRPPQNVKFGIFYVVVMQWRQRNVQNSVMHVQSCCFAKLNLLLFYRSRWRRRRRYLNPLLPQKTWACEQRTANTLPGSCVPTYQTRPLVNRPQWQKR